MITKYALIDPRNEKAFYQGETTLDLERQLGFMIRQVEMGSYGTDFMRTIKSIIEDKLRPIIIEAEDVVLQPQKRKSKNEAY